jgi:hypothetical protein
MGPSCKYLSAVFPAAIPTMADFHSGQREAVDICKCMYFVILCNKTTVHKIIDCSSRTQTVKQVDTYMHSNKELVFATAASLYISIM